VRARPPARTVDEARSPPPACRWSAGGGRRRRRPGGVRGAATGRLAGAGGRLGAAARHTRGRPGTPRPHLIGRGLVSTNRRNQDKPSVRVTRRTTTVTRPDGPQIRCIRYTDCPSGSRHYVLPTPKLAPTSQ